MTAEQRLPAIERVITQTQIDRYATASGDFNPIHIDKKVGEASQFGSTIAHGMMVAAAISEMMTQAFGAHWAEAGRLKIRFKAPVLPGDAVTASGRAAGVDDEAGGRRIRCSVVVKKQTGEEVIAGEASVVVPMERM